jgi:hypothetical protein
MSNVLNQITCTVIELWKKADAKKKPEPFTVYCKLNTDTKRKYRYNIKKNS